MASLAIALCAPAADMAELWRLLARGCEEGEDVGEGTPVQDAIKVRAGAGAGSGGVKAILLLPRVLPGFSSPTIADAPPHLPCRWCKGRLPRTPPAPSAAASPQPEPSTD